MNGVVEMSYLSTTTGLVLIDSRNQSGTITLPEASTVEGRMIYFKDEFGAFNLSTVTLVTDGANVFEDGSTSFQIGQQHGFTSLVASSNTWYRLDGTSNTNRTIGQLYASTLTASSIITYDLTVTGPSTLRVLGSSILNTVENRIWSQLSTVQFGTSASNVLFVSGATAFIDSIPFSTSGGGGASQTSNFSTLTTSSLDIWTIGYEGISTYQLNALSNGVLALETYSTLWVAGGDSGGSVSSILTSEDNGVTWIPQVGILPVIRGLAYSSDCNLWVAVGEHPDPTSSIVTSSDGSNWSVVQSTLSGWSGHCVKYASSMWMAGGSTIGTSILRSFDGVQWTPISTTLDICRSIDYVPACNMWVSGGEVTNAPYEGSNLYTSEDGGDTWTERHNQMGPIYSVHVETPPNQRIWLGASTGTYSLMSVEFSFPGGYSSYPSYGGTVTRAIAENGTWFTVGAAPGFYWAETNNPFFVFNEILNIPFSSINCVKYSSNYGTWVAGGFIDSVTGGGLLRTVDSTTSNTWLSNTSNFISSVSTAHFFLNTSAPNKLRVDGVPYGAEVQELVSTVEGLGTVGYVSTATLLASNSYINHDYLPNTVANLGSVSLYSSVLSYTSTTESIQTQFESNVSVSINDPGATFSKVSTTDLIQTVSTTSTLLGTTLEPLLQSWSNFSVGWTATTSNPTVGNGGLSGRYQNRGETVDFSIHLQIGSTTDLGTGDWRFSLPLNSFSTYAVVAHATMYGSTVAGWMQGSAFSQYNAGHTSTVAVLWNKGQQAGQFVSPTIPFTWSPDDQLNILGRYRVLYNFDTVGILEFARSFAASIGPTSAPTLASSKLFINGNNVGAYEYRVLPRGNVTLTSNTNMSTLFSPIEDTVSSWVFVDGNLTIDSGTIVTPPVRKLFTVLYVNGTITLTSNASISMSARGANHSGTGISGGYTAPVDIQLTSGLISTSLYQPELGFSTLTNPFIAAQGGGGGFGGSAPYSGQNGFDAYGWSGQTGGGGSGGSSGVVAVSGNGGAGTCFSGGTGGGGALSDTAGAGEANGGAGGSGVGTENGAGNPSGGTGGTLIVICEGNIQWDGYITSLGTNRDGLGGASGGGSVNVFTQTTSELIYLSTNGGVSVSGGDGGDGSFRLFYI